MLSIDLKSRTPLYQQIITNIEELVARGIWAQDMPLPSVRQLAVELAINPNTIQRAYAELEARGVIYSLPGRGSFVAGAQSLLQNKRRDEVRAALISAVADGLGCGMTAGELQQILQDAAAAHASTGKGGAGL
ncbi:MAG: GntR family transcriptional regulator [Firmicutes bacterium]|nr:GntR family transcriptional regulator [Bacillota bacterium]